MKSALENNPHSNVIRNFWEKKTMKSAGCFRVNWVPKFTIIRSRTSVCCKAKRTTAGGLALGAEGTVKSSLE